MKRHQALMQPLHKPRHVLKIKHLSRGKICFIYGNIFYRFRSLQRGLHWLRWITKKKSPGFHQILRLKVLIFLKTKQQLMKLFHCLQVHQQQWNLNLEQTVQQRRQVFFTGLLILFLTKEKNLTFHEKPRLSNIFFRNMDQQFDPR